LKSCGNPDVFSGSGNSYQGHRAADEGIGCRGQLEWLPRNITQSGLPSTQKIGSTAYFQVTHRSVDKFPVVSDYRPSTICLRKENSLACGVMSQSNDPSGASLLIVEDEINLAWGLSHYLQPFHSRVEVAHSKGAALQALTHFVPDVILLDLMLPDGDGVDLLKDIRSRGVLSCVIVISARGSPEDKVYLLESGADDYLVKPFAVEELGSAAA
jgi:CheY-like chemotaxis protein